MLPALCAMVVVATRARAQASVATMAPTSCFLEDHASKEVLEAEVLIVEALNARTDSAKRIPLRSAGMVLSTLKVPGALGDKARALQIGRLLVLWLGLDKQPVIASRGSLGFVGDSTEQIDLSAWIDSTFSAVESAVPSCASSTAEWRQYPGWVTLVQRAVRQANVGAFDSASVTVAQASRIYAKHPYTAFVIGQIAESRGEHRTAIAQFGKAIELSAEDPAAYAQVRRTAEVAIGTLALNAARGERNPDVRTFYLAAATEAYTRMAEEPGGAKASQDGLAAVAAASGDASVAQAAYTSIMSDPTATYANVMSAGLLAGSARHTPEAIRLFRRAVELNPYQRDALSDLTVLLVEADSGTSARPFVDRLLTVDPANSNNYALANQVYASLAREATATASRYREAAEALTQPGDAAKRMAYRDSSAAWTDSAAAFGRTMIALLDRKDAIVVGVAFNRWTPNTGSVTLGGTVTNATAAPRTVTVHVEFLDRGGNTVSTSEITLTIDPKRSIDFSVVGAGVGITAFKYTPLT
jgi:tetratricopeptide (TPR) repeat protein